ncbi:MAG: T9SS type A sorting domain-containing protein, partial [Sphingobacteriales bacterium]
AKADGSFTTNVYVKGNGKVTGQIFTLGGVKVGAPFSAIVKVAGIKTAPSITVYPNPVTGKQMQVQFKSVAAGMYQLRLLNTAGQVIFRSAENVTAGSLARSIQLGNDVAAGRYDLLITAPDGSTSNQQVIIQ